MDSIQITHAKHSKLKSTDFKNLGFGKFFSDHMLICDYKFGVWGAPEIVPLSNVRPIGKSGYILQFSIAPPL